MARLLAHVEGPTEVRFVRGVLRDHLVTKGYHEVSARVVGAKKSGICPWASALTQVLNDLEEDRHRVVSTMVDFYGLPATGGKAWPGRAEADRLNGAPRKAACVQDAMREAVLAELGDTRRFVPFVVMHEFEALLFSDCAAFARAVLLGDVEAGLKSIRDAFATPEDINDSEDTAPSKRILKLIPGYQKTRHGEDAAREIGIARMREQCPLFDAWVKRLEDLAYAPAT